MTIALEELKQLKRPISDSDRSLLLAELRGYSTDVDGRRPTNPSEWQRGSLYFHSLQDVRLAELAYHPTLRSDIEYFAKGAQACFVKDLEWYIKHMPQDDLEMKEVFQTIFEVGISAYWHIDYTLVTELQRVYTVLDEEIIGPWVRG